jgi:hypothetical protein
VRHPDGRRSRCSAYWLIGFGNSRVVWGRAHGAERLTAVVVSSTPFWMVAIERLMPNGDRSGLCLWISSLARGESAALRCSVRRRARGHRDCDEH